MKKLTLRESAQALGAIELDPTIKYEFLLVLAEEKPATEWHQPLAFYVEGQPPDRRDPDQITALTAWAKSSGLPYSVLNEHIDDQGHRLNLDTNEVMGDIYAARHRGPGEDAIKVAEDSRSIFVARSATWLAKMLQADLSGEDAQLGACFGFPATAVAAFQTPHMISPDQVEAPAEIKAFAHFMLSRDHWRTELGTAQRWGETVQRLSPQLHKELMLRYQ